MNNAGDILVDRNKLYYLSHPYTTHGDPQMNKARAHQMEVLLGAAYGIKVINPIVLPLSDVNDIAMQKCRHLYNACDAVIFCIDWEKSAGCSEEYKWASEDKKPVFRVTKDYRLESFGCTLCSFALRKDS